MIRLDSYIFRLYLDRYLRLALKWHFSVVNHQKGTIQLRNQRSPILSILTNLSFNLLPDVWVIKVSLTYYKRKLLELFQLCHNREKRMCQLFKFWFDFRLSYSKVYSFIKRMTFDIFQSLYINFRLFP